MVETSRGSDGGDGDSPMFDETLDHNGDRVVAGEQNRLSRNGESETEDESIQDRMMEGEDDVEYDVGENDDHDDDDDVYDEDLSDDSNQDEVMRGFYRDRTMLYEKLLEFFAEDVKQPKGDLTDLVKVG